MKQWMPLVIIAGILLWSASKTKTTPNQTGTVPSFVVGTVPSGTPVDASGNVLLRNRYTHKTMWVSYFDVSSYLDGDWIYA